MGQKGRAVPHSCRDAAVRGRVGIVFKRSAATSTWETARLPHSPLSTHCSPPVISEGLRPGCFHALRCTIARHRAQASWGLPRELKTSVKLQGCTSPVQKRTRVSLSNAPRSGLSKKQSSAYEPSLTQAPSSSSSTFISIHRGFSRVLSIKHQWLHINNPYQVLSRPEQLLCCFLKKY